MTTRTKEEQQQLDEKIARIQKKNEEILRRKKEIEEDIRLAEQQNAIVKLRPTTSNVSRERTPALKPSNRQLRDDFSDDAIEPTFQRSSRGSFRGQSGQRFRGQGDWKTSGPPPDPKSFLYDDERDVPRRDREGKDLRRELDRGKRDDQFGGREFQRGGRRGGGDFRGKRGGRRGGSRSDEEVWKAERLLIDEARIQRQKGADGKWRREWDNEKIAQEPIDEPRHESRRPLPTNQEPWRQSHHQHPPHHHHHHHHHEPQQELHHHDHHRHQAEHECPVHGPFEHTRHMQRGGTRGGRGRGRLDPLELEMPLEKFQIEVLQKQISPTSRSVGGYNLIDDNQRRVKDPRHSPVTPPYQEHLKLDSTRSIECVGNSVKISIPNTNPAQSPPKPQRQGNDYRGRFKSTSYSSQSDDDSPRDRGQRGGKRQRNQKYPKSLPKNVNPTPTDAAVSTSDSLTVPNKPPLPPFRSEQKSTGSVEAKDGDESWEDVTTSGTESMGEELSSVNSSPSKIPPGSITENDTSMNQFVPEEIAADVLEVNNSLEEYMEQVINYSEMGGNLDTSGVDPNLFYEEQILLGLEQSNLDRSHVTSKLNSELISESFHTIDVNNEKIASDVQEILNKPNDMPEGTSSSINHHILHDKDSKEFEVNESNNIECSVDKCEVNIKSEGIEAEIPQTNDLKSVDTNKSPNQGSEHVDEIIKETSKMSLDEINKTSVVKVETNSSEVVEDKNNYVEDSSAGGNQYASEPSPNSGSLKNSEAVTPSFSAVEETNTENPISSSDKELKVEVENVKSILPETEKSK